MNTSFELQQFEPGDGDTTMTISTLITMAFIYCRTKKYKVSLDTYSRALAKAGTPGVKALATRKLAGLYREDGEEERAACKDGHSQYELYNFNKGKTKTHETGYWFEDVKRNRKAEAMHGRVAMLACVRYLAQRRSPPRRRSPSRRLESHDPRTTGCSR